MRKKCRKVFENAGVTSDLGINDFNIYAQLKLDKEFFTYIFLKTFSEVDNFINFDCDKVMYENKEISSSELFDEDGFLETIHGDDVEFVKQMIHTQQFICFLDKAYRIKHNMPENGQEADLDKIQYFFKCIKTMREFSEEKTDEVMEQHITNSIKDYYLHKCKTTIDTFRQQYLKELKEQVCPRFKDLTQYLMHETFCNDQKQLSILCTLNPQLVINKFDQTVYENIDETSKQD